MSRLRSSPLIVIVLALAVLPAARCRTAATAAVEGEEKAMAWNAALDSSGGITGRGMGSIHVSSDGAVTVRGMSGETRSTRAEDTAGLTRLVDGAWAAAWRSPQPPTGGADMIEYELTVDRAGESRKVSWREDAEGELDSRLRSLIAAMRALRPN